MTTPASPDRLDSWKEIADYIGRDVRTAIRWERDRGLPVHRVPGGRRGAVFAYRAEIDEWLRRGEDQERSAPEVLSPPPAGSAAPSTVGPPVVVGRRRRTLQIGALVVLLVAAVAGALLHAVRPSRAGALGAAVVKLDYRPREIVARADDGSVVWRFTPPRPIETVYLDNATTPWYAVLDLDGDGRPEAVASVPLRSENAVPGQNLARDELICFSSTGSVLWRTRYEGELGFRGGSFGPPWTAGRVVAFRSPAGARIAWSLAHHTWWPSPVLLLDERGNRLGTFVHAGAVRALLAQEFKGRWLLLAGGVANAYRSAFLAVLDPEALRGHAPVPPGSPYECTACDEAMPLHYFSFPPSDINQAGSSPYNTVVRFLPFPPEVEAFTDERSDLAAPVAEMSFRFSADFELLDARAADSFAAHEFFERAGKLDHPAARCPWYLHPPPVREWTPGGWRDIAPSTRR